jgi:predicted nucleotidyltransferase
MARRGRLLKAPIHPAGHEPLGEDEFRAIVDRLARELRPEKIILFGSYAYGDPTPDSDVDLLVIMETNASHRERFAAVSRLLEPRPFPVDILVKTPREVREAIAKGDFFVAEIVSRGHLLYERPD